MAIFFFFFHPFSRFSLHSDFVSHTYDVFISPFPFEHKKKRLSKTAMCSLFTFSMNHKCIAAIQFDQKRQINLKCSLCFRASKQTTTNEKTYQQSLSIKTKKMFGGWARNDLQDYRSHYPNNRDDPTLNDNVRFYRNEIPLRPEGKTIEEIHDKWFGDWEFLEYCHSYIQWLFPIQESGLNWQAQILQRHEIDIMKNDPEVLKRILKSFELMLDFYGFEIQTNPVNNVGTSAASKNTQASSSTVPNEFVNSEDATVASSTTSSSSSSPLIIDLTTAFPESCALNPRSRARIVRHSKGFEKQFNNLNTCSHNYLRITRMNKFLGEMGLEHLKLAWLAAFEHELFNDKFLYNCVDSYSRYWIGTIYDDDLREAAEKRAEAGKEAAERLKKAAWEARWGKSASSTTKVEEEPKKEMLVIHGDAEENLRVITDFGSRDNSSVDQVQQAPYNKNNNSNNNNKNDDDDDESSSVNSRDLRQRGTEQHYFRVNTSDLEFTSEQNSRAGTSGMDEAEGSENKNDDQ